MSKGKEKEKVKKVNESEATRLTIEFLRRGNRPYNAQMISDSFKGGLSKINADKVLNSLAEKNQISSKTFGKSILYWINQDDMPEIDKEGLEKMQQNLDGLKEEHKVLSDDIKELKFQLNKLQSQPSNDKADETIENIAKENTTLKAKLDLLQGGQRLVTPEAKDKALKKYNTTRKEWRSRKRMFKDLYDGIREAMADKKLKELNEEIGIETDEDKGVSLDEDQTSKRMKIK